MYKERDSKETVSTVSDRDILILADWWPSEVKDLAELLNVKPAVEATTLKTSDVEKCAKLLKLWQERTGGNQRDKLINLFTENQYYVSGILTD